MKEVYLVWNSYKDNKLILIGRLKQEEDLYKFKYGKDALYAEKVGCMIPFPYQEEEYIFDTLPSFFDQRILKGKFNTEKFGIDTNDGNKLNFLVYNDSKKNSDNFRIITKEKYMSLNM